MVIAVAVVHGMGSQVEGFSHDLQRGVAEVFKQQGHAWDDLVFHEVLWADLLTERQQELYHKVNYKNDLHFNQWRRYFIDYLSDVVAYQPGCMDETDALPIKQKIHQRLSNAFTVCSKKDRVDESKTPLVIVAHSLGTVISFDYLWSMQREQENTSFASGNTLAGFITMGSPLALWTLRYKNFGKPISFPGKWINIYDRDDIIAYPLKKINSEFERVVSQDIELNVGNVLNSWNPLSHSGYWQDKNVHQEIANFLAEILTETTSLQA
jgi:hypothetical protein